MHTIVPRDIISQAEAHSALAGRFAFTLVPDTLAANLLRIGSNVVMQQGEHGVGAWVGPYTGRAVTLAGCAVARVPLPA